MLVKTILNKIEKFKSFVYEKTYFEIMDGEESLIVELSPRKNSRGTCCTCGKYCSTYDTQFIRDYEYVPLWGIRVYLRYAARRVNCKVDGIHIERLPWAEGKERTTKSYQSFLAQWAKRISWKEVARVFNTSWETVFRSVDWVVHYGLAHREWDNAATRCRT